MGIFRDIESTRNDIANLENELHTLNLCCQKKAHIKDLRRIKEIVEHISSKQLRLELLEKMMNSFIPA